MSQTDGLALYQTRSCPYCVRVRSFLDSQGLEIELRDVRAHPEFLEELIGATGMSMVPCLRIEQVGGEVEWMHESTDIIDYLRNRTTS